MRNTTPSGSLKKAAVPPEQSPDLDSAQLPETDSFRAWVRSSVEALGLPVTRLSLASGMSLNTLSRFLRCEGSEIQLGSARRVEAELRARAKERGATLPGVGQ
ncbi:MAG: hypothetical protein IE919_16815 [Thioclava sp.]|nr:hypothetical protein [Thioclava sp.]MBD3804883.1 hypothetical protein [Thioclava sp.]